MIQQLPRPDGTDGDGRPWWRLCSGARVYASPGFVFTPDTADFTPVDVVEQDALAALAAAAWARRTAVLMTTTTTNERG